MTPLAWNVPRVGSRLPRSPRFSVQTTPTGAPPTVAVKLTGELVTTPFWIVTETTALAGAIARAPVAPPSVAPSTLPPPSPKRLPPAPTTVASNPSPPPAGPRDPSPPVAAHAPSPKIAPNTPASHRLVIVFALTRAR